jgi:hypothetical protein
MMTIEGFPYKDLQAYEFTVTDVLILRWLITQWEASHLKIEKFGKHYAFINVQEISEQFSEEGISIFQFFAVISKLKEDNFIENAFRENTLWYFVLDDSYRDLIPEKNLTP